MFSSSQVQLDNYELIVFASPEPRCLYGLRTIPNLGKLQRAWIVEFSDYSKQLPADANQVDRDVFTHYHQNVATLHNTLGLYTSDIERLICRLNLLESFDGYFRGLNTFGHPVVVDISCAPRGHLLALLNFLARCQIAQYQHVVLMYSTVQSQSESEDSFSFGMQDLAVVPGFNGQIRSKHDLLILVLGFEGNRAFSLYERLNPHRAYLILGDTQEDDRSFYIERAKKNNHGLLRIHGIQLRFMPSRDPTSFARRFDVFLEEEIRPLLQNYNVYFSCLGTKLQAVGAFLILQSHQYIQVVDALPTKRRIASEGEREVWFADFGTVGLLDSSIWGE